MSNELIKQLRDLANCRHDDFTVGYEAADRIEQLEDDVAALNKATDIAIEINNDQVSQIEKLETERDQLREQVKMLRDVVGHVAGMRFSIVTTKMCEAALAATKPTSTPTDI